MDQKKPEPRRQTLFSARVLWALIVGLAVGFAVGREAGPWGAADSEESLESVETAAPAPKPPQPATEPAAKVTAEELKRRADAVSQAGSGAAPPGSSSRVYRRVADFPASWVKDSDLPSRFFVGLTETQRATAMQALNERNCECGCSFGSLAACLHKDPNCPRSPTLSGVVFSLAKQDRPLAEIFAAIDRGQGEMNLARAEKAKRKKAQSTGRQKVEIAPWNSRKGPEVAKVTIVEFSDFQ